MKKYLAALLFLFFVTSAESQSLQSEAYKKVQASLQKGWGTYNHSSVLSHVLLPSCIALNIGVKFSNTGPPDRYLQNAFISSRGARSEKIIPGTHALDGSYTEMDVDWQNMKFKVQSAADKNEDLVLLITPLDLMKRNANVILQAAMLWNKPGIIRKSGEQIIISSGTKKITVRSVGRTVKEFVPASSPYIAVKFDGTVAFYTGTTTKHLQDIKAFIQQKKNELDKYYKGFGEMAYTMQGIESVLGWNTIYDAEENRVITPVSRIWNDNFGGQSILFCWDTYFAAYMLSMKDKNLAYANAIEITKSIRPNGFVPNWVGSYRNGSFDRSQPPVGSFVFNELYKKFHDEWLLQYVFEDLLKWNRWWEKNRDSNGLLCWGSTEDSTAANDDASVNTWQGAAYESGLDNSPMYDKVPFNKNTHLMELADVGLTSLYVLDCHSLAAIAKQLHKENIYKELQARASKYSANLQQLWNEEAGIFLNKRTDTKEFSTEISPTNFYPLLAKVATPQQAERMIKEHLLNPDEFNGEWMMPSIAKNSTAFKDQDYWRGRIWGPMNFLVYAGLLNYDLPEAKKILAEKSLKLFNDNRKINGWIFENYNGITGNVSNQEEGRKMGDNFYHWGALLGFIGMMENGFVQPPMQSLKK